MENIHQSDKAGVDGAEVERMNRAEN